MDPMTVGSPLCTPNSLYDLARRRARRGQLWSRLTGRWRGLYALTQVRSACAIEAEIDGGIRTVPIREIRGSEGRNRYFDRDFCPLFDQARGRWLNIAVARQQGKDLPPVTLVQVGDIYFVRDGHHRISVARALRHSGIEAKVTIWQVTGPVPWEALVQPPSRELTGLLRSTGRALKTRGLQDLFSSAGRVSGSIAGV